MNLTKLKRDCTAVRIWQRNPLLWLKARAARIDMDEAKIQAAMHLHECFDAGKSLQENLAAVEARIRKTSKTRESLRQRNGQCGSVWIALVLFVAELILRWYFMERQSQWTG